MKQKTFQCPRPAKSWFCQDRLVRGKGSAHHLEICIVSLKPSLGCVQHWYFSAVDTHGEKAIGADRGRCDPAE